MGVGKRDEWGREGMGGAERRGWGDGMRGERQRGRGDGWRRGDGWGRGGGWGERGCVGGVGGEGMCGGRGDGWGERGCVGEKGVGVNGKKEPSDKDGYGGYVYSDSDLNSSPDALTPLN